MKNLKVTEKELELLLNALRNHGVEDIDDENADDEEVLFNKILKCINKPVETTNEQPKIIFLKKYLVRFKPDSLWKPTFSGNDFLPAYFEEAHKINGDRVWVNWDNKHSCCIALKELDIKEIG